MSDFASLSAAVDGALQRNDYEEAVGLLNALIPTRLNDVRLLINLGGALKELARFDEALSVLTRAILINPQSHGAWSNIGAVCLELQRYDDAIAAFANALRLDSSHGPALSGMGVTLRRRGLPRDALTFFDIAVALSPDDAVLRTARSFAYLAQGDFRRGFAEYEWRLHTQTFSAGLPKGPSWKGEPLAGRTLLLHGEGGLGDILQFCRFIPRLRQMDCRLVIQVPRELVRLASYAFGIPVSTTGESLPIYDLFCTLMSLPHALGVTVDTIPSPGGYLSLNPDIVEQWRKVLDEDPVTCSAGGSSRRLPLKVGLVWSGGKRPWHRENRLMDERRSVSLSALAPLTCCGNSISFYSLQLGAPAAEAANPPPGLSIIDYTPRISDFADTAALVSLLDLVIAVDTSTAHLAGALGQPVWMLSRYDHCWRWLPARTDTPWYNSMRIYTHPAPLEWNAPIEAIARDLARLADAIPHGSASV